MGNIASKSRSAYDGRFASILSADNCDREIFDQPILELRDVVVAPTLGSILPNWLLIVPRSPAANFCEWSTGAKLDPTSLIDQILYLVGAAPERAIWFEHGATTTGSQIGCGIDYAHIHVLIDTPFTFETFTSAALAASDLNWQHVLTADAYRSIDERHSYLVMGSLDRAMLAEEVERVGSQFFRRVVASLVGKPEQWNYHSYPHLENVAETIAKFACRKAPVAVP